MRGQVKTVATMCHSVSCADGRFDKMWLSVRNTSANCRRGNSGMGTGFTLRAGHPIAYFDKDERAECIVEPGSWRLPGVRLCGDLHEHHPAVAFVSSQCN